MQGLHAAVEARCRDEVKLCAVTRMWHTACVHGKSIVVLGGCITEGGEPCRDWLKMQRQSENDGEWCHGVVPDTALGAKGLRCVIGADSEWGCENGCSPVGGAQVMADAANSGASCLACEGELLVRLAWWACGGNGGACAMQVS